MTFIEIFGIALCAVALLYGTYLIFFAKAEPQPAYDPTPSKPRYDLDRNVEWGDCTVRDEETAKEFFDRCLAEKMPWNLVANIVATPPTHWDDSETLVFTRMVLAQVIMKF